MCIRDRLVAVPVVVVTAIGPVVAPAGTAAVICVADTTVKAGWFVPLKVTAVAPMKFVPSMVTDMPTGPLVGLKPVTVGAPATPSRSWTKMSHASFVSPATRLDAPELKATKRPSAESDGPQESP